MKRRFWVSALLTLPVFVSRWAEMFYFAAFHVRVVGRPANVHLDTARSGDAGRCLGRRARSLTQPSVDKKRQPEYVYAHHPRHRGGLFAEPGGPVPARPFSLRRSATPTPASFRVILNRPPSSRLSSCSARCSELRARSQTSSAIRELLRLAPETATVVSTGGTEEDDPTCGHVDGWASASRQGKRKGADRRRDHRRRYIDRRIDGHRRISARGKAGG